MIINGNGLHILNQLRKNNEQTQLSTAKLSSGKRITKAADDAAGMAISEKLRALKIGSNQAVRNIGDAKSLLATADSAMMELSEITQRIRELTIQAMNAPLTDIHSNTSHADTLIIQNEIDALKKNLSDIVANTQFNTRPLLTHPEVDSFTYFDKKTTDSIPLSSATKQTELSHVYNVQGKNEEEMQSETHLVQGKQSQVISTPSTPPKSELLTTVNDHTPRFSKDGTRVIFESTRKSGKRYEMALNGERTVIHSDRNEAASQRLTAGNYTLTTDRGTLALHRNGTLHTKDIPLPNYGYQNGPNGFTFSPNVAPNGDIDILYTTTEGNIAKQVFNLHTGTLGANEELIPNTDILDLPPQSNQKRLKAPPELYRMNTKEASFQITKYNDDGARILTYWDGTGEQPAGGYTVNGSVVTFFGDAIIGEEAVDDAQDYYQFQYVGDGAVDEVYTHDIPGFSNFYNIRGETEGPTSLRVTVGGTKVPREHFLSTKPAQGEQPDGIYIDTDSKKIYMYGKYRPSFRESVRADYLKDHDKDAQTHMIQAAKDINTYNLENPDPTVEKSLRVFVGNREIHYDADKQNGFTYDKKTGHVTLYGDARPDMDKAEKVAVLYAPPTNKDEPQFYEIPLQKRPQVYNLGEEGKPQSIQLVNSKGTIIPYDATKTNGFFYNFENNTIELYGNARPAVKSNSDYGSSSLTNDKRYHEKYTIHMIHTSVDTIHRDDKVEVKFEQSLAETYSDLPEDYERSIHLTINGKVIPYDADKQNGFIYNQETKRFEIYGNARPEANAQNIIRYTYVQENETATIQNGTYDFTLKGSAETYGVAEREEPRAIRVFGPNGEISYDDEHGFTLNETTKQIQLHGDARPQGKDEAKSYRVVSVDNTSLSTNVPNGAHLQRVTFNGQPIERATEDNPHGYVFQNGQVTLVGNARPDANVTKKTGLRVEYFAPKPIPLDVSALNGEDAYCEHETESALPDAELVIDSVVVRLNGETLTDEQYTVINDAVHLRYDNVTLIEPKNAIEVEYQIKQNDSFKDNQFIFQTGPNAFDHVHASIRSFDTMLRHVSPICVREYDHAAIALGRIDEAIAFISTELGNVGALMNRLDHNESNVRVGAEQLASALSRIEDADMAKEKMNEVKASILQQAQHAMLAHFNDNESRVLQLLK